MRAAGRGEAAAGAPASAGPSAGFGHDGVGQEAGRSRPDGRLPSTLRKGLEGRFRTSFADVRVHDDSEAHRRTADVGARAFAQGRDIYFGAGAYRPDTKSGQALLAHELTHVVQQRNGRLPASAPAAQRVALRVDLEREAERAASMLHAGAPINVHASSRADEALPDFLGDLQARVSGGIESVADWVMSQTSTAQNTLMVQLNALRGTLRGRRRLLISPEMAVSLQNTYDTLRQDLPGWIPAPELNFSGGPAQYVAIVDDALLAAILLLAFLIVWLWYAGNLNPKVRADRERAVRDVVSKIKKAVEQGEEPEKKPDPDSKPPPTVDPVPDIKDEKKTDACIVMLGLSPGRNDRWWQPRPPIGTNTTVAAAVFRLDAGIQPFAGQDTNPTVRDWARSIGQPDDQAGHVIANRFGGLMTHNGPNGNIFPQDPYYNMGAMRSYDAVAAGRHAAGCDVCVHIGLNYESATALRPSDINTHICIVPLARRASTRRSSPSSRTTREHGPAMTGAELQDLIVRGEVQAVAAALRAAPR